VIYLLGQMSIIIILAAIAGGALGWVFHRLRSQKSIRELRRVITQQQQQVKQSHSEVAMLAQDYDELKQNSTVTVDELRQETRQIPNLHSNLEKSQLLVRQLMQKHEAQIREFAAENESLKATVKHLDDRERALNKLQAEVDRSRRELLTARRDQGNLPPADAKTKAAAAGQAQATKSAASATVKKAAASASSNVQREIPKSTTRAQPAASSSSAQNQTTTRAAATRTTATANDDNRSEISASKVVAKKVSSTASATPSLLAAAQSAKTSAHTKAETTSELASDPSTPVQPKPAQPVPANNEPTAEDGDTLDLSADISGEAGSLTIALAEADIVLAALDRKREREITISDDEVIDASELDLDVEFAEETAQTENDELLFEPVDQHDDLQAIFGIGPVTERGLNNLGITSYSQLADLKRHDIEKIASALEIVPGKIERENWVGNARRQLEEVLEEL